MLRKWFKSAMIILELLSPACSDSISHRTVFSSALNIVVCRTCKSIIWELLGDNQEEFVITDKVKLLQHFVLNCKSITVLATWSQYLSQYCLYNFKSLNTILYHPWMNRVISMIVLEWLMQGKVCGPSGQRAPMAVCLCVAIQWLRDYSFFFSFGNDHQYNCHKVVLRLFHCDQCQMYFGMDTSLFKNKWSLLWQGNRLYN